jgi:hypothetical protein
MSNKDKKMPTPSSIIERGAKRKIKNKSTPIVRKPVFTTTKQISRYITISGIVSEISWEQKAWPKIAEKEMLTNAWDFLNVYYQPETHSKDYRYIGVTAMLESSIREDINLLRLTVRNSNHDKHEVFQNLDLVFDYDNWQSTKRNQYLGTGGALGDFLKRVLGMGYAGWTEGCCDTIAMGQCHDDDDENNNNYNISDSAVDNGYFDSGVKQWLEPLILRFNGQEYRVFLVVDSNISVGTKIEGPINSHAIDYTEICATLPVTKLQCLNSTYYNGCLQLPLLEDLEEYFKAFRLGKRNTTNLDFVIERNNSRI